MAKKIELMVVDSGRVKAMAELLEEDAPAVCEAMWKALEVPMETKGIHAMWSGREIMLEMPEENQRFDPTKVPVQNATIYPLPGDLCWAYFPPYWERGFTRGIFDFMIIYGPETVINCAVGPVPVSVWAHITEGLEEFAEECAKIRIEGLKTFRVRRVEE